MDKVSVLIYLLCEDMSLSRHAHQQDADEFVQQASEEECHSYSEVDVKARGGVEALEHDLGETCEWFAQIGRVQAPARKGGRITLPLRVIQPLRDNWIARGAPKNIGWRHMELALYRAIEDALEREASRPADGSGQDSALACGVTKYDSTSQ